MKRIMPAILTCLIFFSCDLFTNGGSSEEPSYTTKIAWDSDLFSNFFESHIVDGDSVFFYERPPGYTTVNIYSLTHLNAETGEFIRRSSEFRNIIWCQPIVTNGYVYVFQEPNFILCFERETLKQTAIVKIDIENKKLRMDQHVTYYQNNLYFGMYNDANAYFVRLNIGAINQNGTSDPVQVLSPDIVWEPATNSTVSTKPVVYNNVVYTGTYGAGYDPVELAGFDTSTKEMVFYQKFGGPEDGDVPFPEKGGRANNIFIHDDVLYYISWSIAAWDLNTGERLYRHVFSWDTPNAKIFSAPRLIQAEYYKGNIYFTNGSGSGPEGFRNIHCINAKTGKVVWNDARSRFSLDSNVIIANDLLYVTQSIGLLVYKPETGKLVGIDKSFCATDMGRNVLYNNYIICVQVIPGEPEGKLVAIDVSK